MAFRAQEQQSRPGNNEDWCPGKDSNLHASRHTDLNRARLPIPPPGPVSGVHLGPRRWGVNAAPVTRRRAGCQSRRVWSRTRSGDSDGTNDGAWRMANLADIGVLGLAVMGANLARNAAHKG